MLAHKKTIDGIHRRGENKNSILALEEFFREQIRLQLREEKALKATADLPIPSSKLRRVIGRSQQPQVLIP